MYELLNSLRITTPVDMIVGLLLAWGFTSKNVFLFLVCGYFFNSFVLNYLFRRMMAYIFGSRCFVFRPLGYPEGQCGVYWSEQKENNPSCRPVSFPSLHGQSFGFLLIFIVMYFFRGNYTTGEVVLSVFLLIFYLFLILALQLVSSCETVMQIIAGLLVGGALGLLWYLIYDMYEDSIDNKTF